jgi:hypothetical protein
MVKITKAEVRLVFFVRLLVTATIWDILCTQGMEYDVTFFMRQVALHLEPFQRTVVKM